MLTAQIGMLVTSAVLALLSWLGQITPLLLLALTVTLGIGTALNSPAWQASVRQQVGMRDLPQAIMLNTISFNLARSVGPALGGLLISLWNVTLAFAINAVSYIAMIVVLFRWRPETPPRERRSMLPAIADGMRFCAGSSPIRRVLIARPGAGFRCRRLSGAGPCRGARPAAWRRDRFRADARPVRHRLDRHCAVHRQGAAALGDRTLC